MTIRPYKTIDNRIDGALVTLEDINDLKQGMLRIQEARDYAEAIVETVREPLIVLNKDLRVVTANQAYYKNFEATPDAIENKYFYDLQDGIWNIPRLRQLLEDTIRENAALNDFEVDYEAPGDGPQDDAPECAQDRPGRIRTDPPCHRRHYRSADGGREYQEIECGPAAQSE